MIVSILKQVIGGQDLRPAQMEEAMGAILAGQVSDVQIAALAVALRMKGETSDELWAAARVLRRQATPLEIEGDSLDTCGTGGDGANTFNISTTAALIVAACGVRVAKHGNRAVSSRSGSADVLEALGVRLDAAPITAQSTLADLGIAFLFAPSYHGALRHAASVRRDLGMRTFFNLLGPLANPAGASHQLLGVYDPDRVRQMAEVLGELGVARAWVVHGEGGLDEVSPAGPTRVAVLNGGQVSEREVCPADFGLPEVPLSALCGGDAEENAQITLHVLEGKPGPARVVSVLNAAAALCVVDADLTPKHAALRAAEALDSGAARALLRRWVERSVECTVEAEDHG